MMSSAAAQPRTSTGFALHASPKCTLAPSDDDRMPSARAPLLGETQDEDLSVRGGKQLA